MHLIHDMSHNINPMLSIFLILWTGYALAHINTNSDILHLDTNYWQGYESN